MGRSVALKFRGWQLEGSRISYSNTNTARILFVKNPVIHPSGRFVPTKKLYDIPVELHYSKCGYTYSCEYSFQGDPSELVLRIAGKCADCVLPQVG